MQSCRGPAHRKSFVQINRCPAQKLSQREEAERSIRSQVWWFCECRLHHHDREATAYGVRHIFEAMRESGGGGERLVAVGGETKGGLWTQIVSDVTGRPQELPEQTIGASYGDALLAARPIGLAKPGADRSNIAATVEPKEENTEIYDERYRIYRELYPATREQRHNLADMQK